MYRILIADDHPIVRQGLQRILSEEFRGALFGEADNAREVIEQVQRQDWDLLVLDITMPGKSGFQALTEVKQICPRLPVLVMSIHPEEQYAYRVLRAGASGYVVKDSSRDELLSAFRKVLGGKKYISLALAEKLAAGRSDKPPHETLSDRELEVLRGIVSGKSLTEIAWNLSLSIKTVSTYRKRVLEKMGLSSNAELTRYALENNLIP